MANSYNYNRDLVSELESNLGRLITIFTEGGGCDGNQFTGILVDVECNAVKLVTDVGRRPFGTNNTSNGSCPLRNSVSASRCSDLSTTVLIPTSKITAVASCQL